MLTGAFRDTRSLQNEWSWLVAKILAGIHASSCPSQAPGNEACESRRGKPKGRPNHRANPGKGKLGRVNASESPLRLREVRLPNRWLTRQ